MIRFRIHGYGTFDQEHAIGPAMWSCFDLITLHEGSVSITFGRRQEHRLAAGEAVLIYPQTHFKGHALAAPARAAVQHFEIERNLAVPEPFSRFINRRNGFEIFGTYALLDNDVARAVQLSVRPPDSLVHQERVAQLTLILGELIANASGARWDTAVDATLDEVMDWAQANLSQRPRIEDLAERAGLSSSRFRQYFKQRTGMSAGRFLRDISLAEATRLLRETRHPIKQIAQASGYSDVIAFHHAFKAKQQMTPAEYRRIYTPRG